MMPLKGFTAPHFCSYSKPNTGSQISYEVVFLCSMAWGEGLLFLLLILVELLTIFSQYHTFCKGLNFVMYVHVFIKLLNK